MRYTIDFNNNTVESFFMDLYHSFAWSERAFEDNDLSRNVVNTTCFCQSLMHLEIFGADTERGTYSDGDFIRIGFAKINDHVFIKNGVINTKELKDALWEIAHPEEEELL